MFRRFWLISHKWKFNNKFECKKGPSWVCSLSDRIYHPIRCAVLSPHIFPVEDFRVHISNHRRLSENNWTHFLYIFHGNAFRSPTTEEEEEIEQNLKFLNARVFFPVSSRFVYLLRECFVRQCGVRFFNYIFQQFSFVRRCFHFAFSALNLCWVFPLTTNIVDIATNRKSFVMHVKRVLRTMIELAFNFNRRKKVLFPLIVFLCSKAKVEAPKPNKCIDILCKTECSSCDVENWVKQAKRTPLIVAVKTLFVDKFYVVWRWLCRNILCESCTFRINKQQTEYIAHMRQVKTNE